MATHLWGWPILARERHIPLARLETMRYDVDELGDEMYEALSQCGLSLTDVLAAPPNHANTTDKRIAAFLESVRSTPSWLDMSLLRQGQLTFLKYASSGAMGLLYFSLIGGFSAPKIISVLDATGYLTSASNHDKTWRRLNETLEMVVDVLDGEEAMEIDTGKGWLAVLKVRLLHSSVRRRLLSASASSPWDIEAHGLPINQEDMVGTLLSFSENVLETIRRIGAPWLSKQEEYAYLHLWRYVGFLIGVKEVHNPLISLEASRGAIESIVLHLLHPNARSKTLAKSVLQSVTNRPPFRWSFEQHSAATRALLGDELSNALGIKKSGFTHWLYTFLFFKLLFLLNWLVFSRINSHKSPLALRVRRLLRLNVTRALEGLGRAVPNEQASDAPSCPFAR